MRIYWHLLINFALAILAKLLFNFDNMLLIFFVIMGGAIDLDHPFPTIIKEKTLNPRKIIKIHQELYKKHKADFYIFHSPEFNILLGLMSFLNIYFFAAFLSNLIHISIDISMSYKKRGSIEDLKNWSILYNLFK